MLHAANKVLDLWTGIWVDKGQNKAFMAQNLSIRFSHESQPWSYHIVSTWRRSVTQRIAWKCWTRGQHISRYYSSLLEAQRGWRFRNNLKAIYLANIQSSHNLQPTFMSVFWLVIDWPIPIDFIQLIRLFGIVWSIALLLIDCGRSAMRKLRSKRWTTFLVTSLKWLECILLRLLGIILF